MIHLRLPFNEPRRLPFYLAMEEWAAQCLPADEYFFSWRVKPTVICGRNQEMDKEVDMEYCRTAGIDVVRRRSGGGCVFADMDNFMFSYISPGDEITATFARYTTMIAAELRNMGLEACATGRNDIVIDGRKVSGNAFYHLPGRCIAHGTMLYDFNPAVMSRAITPSRAKLESKSVKSVHSRVTCLKEAGLKLSPEDFEHNMIAALCDKEILLSPEDIVAIENIEQNYYDPAFLYRKGENAPKKSEDSSLRHIHGHIDGVGEFALSIAVDSDGRISRMEASGDFFLLDDPETMIFSRLKGTPFTRDDLEKAIYNTEPEKAIAGLDRAALLHILTEKTTLIMESEMKKTCLFERHMALNAKMAPFAGYDMPIEYSGLDTEHKAVRTCSGLFDVSHMGEIYIAGRDAVKFVDHIFTNYAAPMKIGQVLYGMMTYETGGTVDDLLVYRLGEESFLLVVNASNLEKDVAWVRDCAEGYDVEIRDYSADCGQLALQGPDSEKIMKTVFGLDVSALTFYTFTVLDGNMIVSRTGYTGEDGFEIYADPRRIVEMWNSLTAYGIQPCGLGCRDTLRFEAGLPLYGDELAEDITPIEAGLGMFVKLDKPGGFIGSEALAKQKVEGPRRKLVGLEIDSPATARHGFEVLDLDGAVVGHITTGYNSLTLGKNIAMAIVDARYAPLETKLQVRIRRKLAPATVIKKRFYIPQYKK